MAACTAPESRIFMRLFSCLADEKKPLQAAVFKTGNRLQEAVEYLPRRLVDIEHVAYQKVNAVVIGDQQ